MAVLKGSVLEVVMAIRFTASSEDSDLVYGARTVPPQQFARILKSAQPVLDRTFL